MESALLPVRGGRKSSQGVGDGTAAIGGETRVRLRMIGYSCPYLADGKGDHAWAAGGHFVMLFWRFHGFL